MFGQGFFQIDPNLTPEEVAERRQRIATMTQRPTARYAGEGLAQLGAGIIGGIGLGKLNKVERTNRAGGDEDFVRGRDYIQGLINGTPTNTPRPGPMTVLGIPDNAVDGPTPIPESPAQIASDAMTATGNTPDFTPFAVGGAASRGDSFSGLDPQFASAVHRMTADAHAAGIPLQITSAYRSPEVQAQLWEAAVAKYGSPEAARKWVAPPGRSMHNKGVAVDYAVDGSLIRDANSPAARWIKENAARYGLDVPMEWEPWQVEMAGSRQGGGQPMGGQPAMGGSNPLTEALANPWLTHSQRAVLMDMLEQQRQASDPLRALQLQEAQLKIDAMRNGGGGQTEFGLTPQYVTNADGSLGMIQLGKDGSVNTVQLPEGMALQRGLEKLDLGTHFQWYNNLTGEEIGEPIPKDLAGEAAEKARGAAEGQRAATTAAEAPQVVAQATETINLIDSIVNDPNLPSITGKYQGRLDPEGPSGLLMSQDEVDLAIKVNQLQGRAFLEAFESLKGGGQITEREGQAAQAAIARLQRVQSDREYIVALNELRTIADNARRRASGEEVPEYVPEAAPPPPAPAQGRGRVRYDAEGNRLP